MASAAHLAEHLAEVPVIVIPTIIGVHDGSGRPGLFDSVIQSAWSFCVALRARGLGTAWTTAILTRDATLAETARHPRRDDADRDDPGGLDQGHRLPPAPRYPARAITYFDGFARTWEPGPSDPPRPADGPGTVVEVDIKAPPAAVWPFVTDIDVRRGQFSEEFVGARWADGVDGPAVGAQFVGTNTHPAIGQWEVPCFVDALRAAPRLRLGHLRPGQPRRRWRFELASIAGATRLRFSVVLGPGPSGITAAIERDARQGTARSSPAHRGAPTPTCNASSTASRPQPRAHR